jgi:uncharacterized protein DUF4399
MKRTAMALLFALSFTTACDETQAPAPTGTGAKPSASAKPGASATTSASAPAPTTGGKAFFVVPIDAAKVFPDALLAFGSTGIEVAPKEAAGEDGKKGYYVVVVDADPVAKGADIPADDKHVHFAKGEKDGTVKLTEGEHKLTLQLADAKGKAIVAGQPIKVTVVKDEGERKVAFLEPKDGAKVKSPFKVKFDVKGMKIQNAGEAPADRVTGHHHVLVDQEAAPVGFELPMNDPKMLHYGKGQTEAEIKDLPPGKHKLTMQFADGAHRSYGPSMSATITVEVQ